MVEGVAFCEDGELIRVYVYMDAAAPPERYGFTAVDYAVTAATPTHVDVTVKLGGRRRCLRLFSEPDSMYTVPLCSLSSSHPITTRVAVVHGGTRTVVANAPYLSCDVARLFANEWWRSPDAAAVP
jgi:hypothetical protein